MLEQDLAIQNRLKLEARHKAKAAKQSKKAAMKAKDSDYSDNCDSSSARVLK